MSYNRRLFLRDLGVVVSLPVLPSLMTSKALAQQQGVKDKFIGVFSPNGALMPRGANGNWNFAQALAPIVTAQNQGNVSIIRGLSAAANHDPHWTNVANMLSGHPIRVPNRSVVQCGKTFDQYVADLYPTRELRSLHVGWREMNRDFTGDHPSFSDLYLTSLSWRATDRPVSNINSPQQLYSQIFSSNQRGQQRLLTLNAQKASVLDLTHREIQSIKNRAGQEDKIRLEGFQDNLRTLEKDLTRQAPTCGGSLAQPPSVLDYTNHFVMMQRMIATAMQCDLISSATIMYDDGVGDVRLRHLGSNRDHHSYAHSPQLGLVNPINQLHAGIFSNLLDELKSRALLEKTVIVWSSNMSDGAAHITTNVPTVVASAGPGLNLGVEIGNAATPVPRANLFVELAPLFGLNMPSFGAGVSASNGARIPLRT